MTTTTSINKQALKSSFDRVRNRLNTLERIAAQMKGSSDPAVEKEHSTVVSIVADLRTEITNWQEMFTGGE